jgi:hypothetical protein
MLRLQYLRGWHNHPQQLESGRTGLGAESGMLHYIRRSISLAMIGQLGITVQGTNK